MNTPEHLTVIETVISDSTSTIPQPVRDQLLYSTGYRAGKVVMKRRLLLSSTFSCLLTILVMQLFQFFYIQQWTQDNLANSEIRSSADPRNTSPRLIPTESLRSDPTPNYLATTPRSTFLIDSDISENDLSLEFTADLPNNILTPRNLIGL